MTRVTKMKRKRVEEASEFVSIDIKESAQGSPNSGIPAVGASAQEEIVHEAQQSTKDITETMAENAIEDGKKKKRSRHRHLLKDNPVPPKEPTPPIPTETETDGMSKEERQALRRRNRRLRLKEKNTMCFLCRQVGHSISNCPKNVQKSSDFIQESDLGSICYRCGSLEHVLAKCDKKGSALPFSTCFVCKQKGHLAGQCPENDRGVYPNGGSCKFCGSVRHLANECKPLDRKDQIMLGKISIDQGGDDDDVFLSIKKQAVETKVVKKTAVKKKVVAF